MLGDGDEVGVPIGDGEEEAVGTGEGRGGTVTMTCRRSVSRGVPKHWRPVVAVTVTTKRPPV